MPEISLSPFGGEGTVEDANKIKAAVPAARKVLIEKFGADPVALDKEIATASNLASAVGEGLEFGAELAAAGRAVPGRVGGLISALFIGQHRNPDTGKYQVGQPFLANAAPSPVGYGPPSKFGLKKNWYLPPGVVGYTPEVIDSLGIGLPEQRAEDERNERIRFDKQLRDQMNNLSRLSSAQLEKIAAEGPVTTGQKIGRLFAPVTPPDLERRQEAAKFVLAQRAAAAREFGQQTLVPPATAANVAEAAEALALLLAAAKLEAAQKAAAGQTLDPFATPPLGGSVQVGLIPALTGTAVRQRLTARGINRELVTELIDP